MGIAEDLIIIILAGLVSGLIANKLKIPPIVGYIIAGILVGPYVGILKISDIPQIELLAEIGVALLLFSIGLDFSFKELKAVKGIALIGTPLQILALTGFGLGIGIVLNMPLSYSIILGMVISLSSTMVVLKILINRGLTGTLSSRVMIGILIVQDLAAIPMMLIIPNINSMGDSLLPLFVTLIKAALILAAVIFIGLRIIPWILKFVVKLNSREMFLITVTALGLGIGYLTHLFGLSLAFGAFVAGMVINESDFSHKALDDIIPLRDIFGLVFFTSIGMLLNPVFVYDNFLTFIILIILVLAGKFIVFSVLSIVFKYRNIMPLALGFGLAQIGEFSFVLARAGLKHNVISNDFYSLILSVTVITMLLSPFISMLAVPLYSLKKKWFGHEQMRTVNLPDKGLSRHIIITGGGRVGFQIGNILQDIDLPFIIIERDFSKFERIKNAGYPAIYSEAGREEVLKTAGIDKATLLIITIPDLFSAREMITIAMKHNPDIKIIARADDLAGANEFFRMNIFEVVQPEFEASLEIIRQSLLLLDVPLTSIYGFTDEIRQKNFTSLKKNTIQQSLSDKIKKTQFLLEMYWFRLPEGNPASGKTIAGLEVRTKTGASIVGIVRDKELIPNPDAGFALKSGDYMAIIGLPENKVKFRNMLNL